MASSPMKKTAKAEEKVRRIVDPEFSHRINIACDTDPQVPAYNYGRLTWARDKLLKLHDLDVSLETARKWFADDAMVGRSSGRITEITKKLIAHSKHDTLDRRSSN